MAVEKPKHGGEAEAWRVVRQWPALRGESKIAWLFLWGQAGGRPGSVITTATAIGAHMGTSQRSGRRALDQLAGKGFLEISDHWNGRFTLYVSDPLEVARRARLSPVASDCQGELFGDARAAAEELESPRGGEGRGGGDAAASLLFLPQPPADPAPKPPTATQDTNTLRVPCLETRNTKEIRAGVRVAAGGSGDGSAEWWRQQLAKKDAIARAQRAAQATEKRLGDEILPDLADHFAATMTAASKVTQEERTRQAEELARSLAELVKDPDTLPSTWRRIGWAVAGGALERQVLDRVVRSFRDKRQAGKIRGPHGAYFLGAIKQQLRKVGIDWRGQA